MYYKQRRNSYIILKIYEEMSVNEFCIDDDKDVYEDLVEYVKPKSKYYKVCFLLLCNY